MPAPIVRMAELSQRREITGSLSQQGEGDDRQTVVQFDELSLSLVFDVRRDTAPQRETRDIIHVEIGQTPEPIFSFGSPMLVFPNCARYKRYRQCSGPSGNAAARDRIDGADTPNSG